MHPIQDKMAEFVKLIAPDVVFFGFIMALILSLMLFCIVVLVLLKIIGWLAGVDLIGGLKEAIKREAEAQDKDVKHGE